MWIAYLHSLGLVLNPNLFDRGLDSLLGYPVIPSLYTHADILNSIRYAREYAVSQYNPQRVAVSCISVRQYL